MVLNIYFNISDYVFYILWVDGGASMDIAIIDDEQVFLEIFKSDVIKICNDNDIECYIDTFNSARNIMEIYKKLSSDIFGYRYAGNRWDNCSQGDK